jgi:hypothetical protein
MNKKIAIGRQGPKPCVVVGMDRASATRVKWEFMKDSKGMFDTHQLSLGRPNFDKLRLELLFRSSLTETPTFRFSFLLPQILYRRPSRASRTPSREALQSPNVRIGNVFERNELGSQHDYGLRCPRQYMRICANAAHTTARHLGRTAPEQQNKLDVLCLNGHRMQSGWNRAPPPE